MYIQYLNAIKMSAMKSTLYSTPVVQSLQTHHPIVASICGMSKHKWNAKENKPENNEEASELQVSCFLLEKEWTTLEEVMP